MGDTEKIVPADDLPTELKSGDIVPSDDLPTSTATDGEKKNGLSSPAPVDGGSTSSVGTLSMDVLKPQNNPKTPDLTGIGAYKEPENLQDFNKPQETERVDAIARKRAAFPNLHPAAMAAQQNPSRDTHFNLGTEYLKSGDYEQAIMSFDEAANFPAQSNITNSQEKAFNQAVQDDALAYSIGIAYQKLGKLDDAKRMWQVALEKNHKNPDAKTALAWQYFNEGDKEAAKKYSEETQADYAERIPAQPDRIGESEYEKDLAARANAVLQAAEGIILGGGEYGKLPLLSPVAFGKTFVEGAVDLVKGFGTDIYDAIKLAGEAQKKASEGKEVTSSESLMPYVKLIEGGIKGGFAYMQATNPAVFAAWHEGNAVGETVLPEDIVKTIMSPASQLIDNAGNDKLKQGLTNILDTFGNLVIFHKLSGLVKPNELARKIKNNEPLTPDEAKVFVEAVEEIKPEEIKQAVEKTKADEDLAKRKEELNTRLTEAEEMIKNIPEGETPAERIENNLLKNKLEASVKEAELELTTIIENEHKEVEDAGTPNLEQQVEVKPEDVNTEQTPVSATKDVQVEKPIVAEEDPIANKESEVAPVEEKPVEKKSLTEDEQHELANLEFQSEALKGKLPAEKQARLDELKAVFEANKETPAVAEKSAEETPVSEIESDKTEGVFNGGVKLNGSPREMIKELKERKDDNAVHAEIFQENGYNVLIYDNIKILVDKTFKTHEEAKKHLDEWSSKNGKANKLKYDYGTIEDIANPPYRQEITGNLPKDFIDKNKVEEKRTENIQKVKIGQTEYELTIDEKGKAHYKNTETGKELPDTTDRYYRAEEQRRKSGQVEKGNPTEQKAQEAPAPEVAPPSKAKDLSDETEEENVKDDKEALKKIETDKDIFKAEKSPAMIEKRYKGNSDRLKKALDEKKISKSAFNKLKKQLDEIYEGKKDQTAKDKEAFKDALKVGIKDALGIKPGDTTTKAGLFDSNRLVDDAVDMASTLLDAVDETGAKLYDLKEAVQKVIDYLKTNKNYKKLFDDKTVDEEVLRKQLEDKFTEAKAEEPPPGEPEKPSDENGSEEDGTKKLKLGKRLLESEELTDSMKRGLQEEGIDYVPVELKVTNEAAKAYVEYMKANDGLEEAFNHVMNTENKMDGLTRATIGGYLFDEFARISRTSTDLAEAAKAQEKAIQLGLFTAKNLKTAGQEINAGKMWKKMLSKIPETAIVEIATQYEKANEAKLTAEKGNIEDAKKILKELLDSPEFKEWVEKEYGKKSAPKETGTSPKKENIFNSKSFRDKRKEELKERWKTAKSSSTSSSFVGLNKEQIEIVGEYAAIYVAEGVHQFAKLAKKLKKDFPELTEKQIKHVWENYQVPAEIDSKQRTLEKYTKIGVFENMPPEIKKKLVDKWEKRLTNLTPERRKKLLADSIMEIERSGMLSEEAFKKLYSEALGLPTVTPELSAHVTKLVNTINDGEDAMANVKKLLDNNAPKEDIKAALAELEKKMFAARQANDELSNYFKGEKRLGNTLGAILQGNLLTSMSVIQSLYSNVIMLPLRTINRGLASSMDYMESKIAKIAGTEKLFKEQRTADALAYWKGRSQYIFPAAKTGFKELLYGIPTENLSHRDISQKLEPFKAAAKFYEGLSGEEKQTVYQQLNNFSEALFGIPAAGMFRLLNLTDTPFTDSSRKALARELGVLNGLKGNELEKFILEPDAIDAEKINEEALSQTYQQGGGAIQDLQRRLAFEEYFMKNSPKLLGDAIKVLTTAVKPYIKTPLNIVKDVFEWSLPQYSFIMGVSYAMKGERRMANDMMAKAVVGLTIQSAYQILVQNNLVQPPIRKNDPDKDKKIIYENTKPNSINITGLQRMLTGGSPATLETDEWWDLTKMGVPGIVMGVQASLHNSESKDMGMLEKLGKTSLYTVKSSFDMSFLQGTNMLLNAIGNGERDENKWIVAMSEALSSIAIPNTISSISKAGDTYIDESKNIELRDKLRENFKGRLFMKKENPSLVTMWGEKVKRVPEGENPYVYMLFDIRKGRKIATNSIGYKLYDIWEKLPNEDPDKDKLFPSIPKSVFSYKKEKIDLTPELYESYQMHIGINRKRAADRYVNSVEFTKDSLEAKVKKLQKFYEDGMKNGKRAFMMEHKEEIDKMVFEKKKETEAKKAIKK